MDIAVRAFPILEGKEDAMRQFAQTLSTARSAEAGEFFRRYGISREVWCVQDTPSGSWVIAVTITPERSVEEAASEYAQSAAGFERWFKSQVVELTGIDPTAQPLGPPTELIFDTRDL